MKIIIEALEIWQGLMKEVFTNGWADFREGDQEVLSVLNSMRGKPHGSCQNQTAQRKAVNAA